MVLLLVAGLLVGASIVLLVAGRLHAAAALLLVCLYINLSDIGVRHHWPSIAQPLVLLFAAIAFVRSSRSGAARSFPAAAGFWCAAVTYLAVVLASSIWAVDGGASAHQAADLAKDLLIVYVIVEVFDTAAGQRLAIWALIGAGAALAALSVLQAVTHTYSHAYLGFAQADLRQLVGTTNGYRSAGPLGDPNFYGLMLVAVVPLSAFRFFDETRRSLRGLALVATALLLGGVGLTYSRGALVGLAVVVAGILVSVRFPVRYLLAAGVALVALAAIAPSHYIQRLSSSTQSNHSYEGHLDSQRIALAMFADHPLLGVGADNYTATYQAYGQQLHAVDAASTDHDVYLAVASETGLIGLIAFCGAMLAVFRRGLWRRADALQRGDREGARLATAGFLALAAYLTGCLFVPIAYPRYLWLFAGLALCIALPSKRPEAGRST